jgi:hypothetical protein
MLSTTPNTAILVLYECACTPPDVLSADAGPRKVWVRLLVVIYWRFLTDLASPLELVLRRDDSNRPDQDASSYRACCFDQKEESSLIGRDLFSFLLFQRREAVDAF